MIHDDKYRDWLILSTKRPCDEVVWYASGFAGYTTNLLRAGRYTEAEAKMEAARVPHYLIAVHFEDAMSMSELFVIVPNGTAQMERLRSKVAARCEEKAK